MVTMLNKSYTEYKQYTYISLKKHWPISYQRENDAITTKVKNLIECHGVLFPFGC